MYGMKVEHFWGGGQRREGETRRDNGGYQNNGVRVWKHHNPFIQMVTF